jgi:putative oxidoreductase
MTRAKTVIGWVLQVLVGAMFVLIGLGKFGDPSWAQKFERWGYPPGSHLIVGIIEAGAGLALLVPRLTSYAAGVLVVVMAGAAVTHLVHGEMERLSPPLAYIVILSLVAWLRWPKRALRPSPPLAISPPVT